MERLQVALEKARSARETLAPEAADPAAPAQPAPQEPPVAGASDAWAALSALELPHRQGRNSRLSITGQGVQGAAFDLLRTRLLQQTKQHGWRRIAVVSSSQGEGKTMITAHLAFAMARQDELRTMVLDLDMRRPNMAATLDVTSPPGGMAEVLRGEKTFAEHGRRIGNNLAFGLNDRPARNTAELLQSQRSAETLVALETRYQPDYVLFDLPPLLGADDSQAFLRNVDAAILVVEAEKTPIKQIDHVERQIAELTNVLGIVLNKCRYRDAIYGGSYKGYY